MSLTSSTPLNLIELESELYENIKHKDWDSVETLLGKLSEPLPVKRRVANSTLLHYATEIENVPPHVIRSLASRLEPSWRHPNKWGVTPLHNAIQYNLSTQVISILLEADLAAIDVADRSGNTPIDYFHWRILVGDEDDDDAIEEELTDEAVELLRLLAGAWMTYSKNSSQNLSTPLHKALNTTFPDPDMPERIVQVMKVLLEDHPSMAQAIDNKGCTPLHLAARYDDVDAMERMNLLLQMNPPSTLHVQDEDGRTPISEAVFWCASVEVVETLVAASPTSIMIVDRDNKTPLDHVCDIMERDGFPDRDALDVAKTLVLGTTDQQHSDSVLLASTRIKNCPVELFRAFLLVYPEQAQSKDEKGNLPLHLAAAMTPKPKEQEAFVSFLQELIQAFPLGPNTPNDNGLLPLGSFLCVHQEWNQGLRVVFEAHPAAVLDQGLPPYAMTTLLSKFSEWSLTPTVLYQLLHDAPSIVSRETS